MGLSLLTMMAQSGYTLTLCHCRLEGHFHIALGGVDGDCCFAGPLSPAEGCTSDGTAAACCKTSQTQEPCCEHTLLRFQKTDPARESGSLSAENISKFQAQAPSPTNQVGNIGILDARGGFFRPLGLPDAVKAQDSWVPRLCVWRN